MRLFSLLLLGTIACQTQATDMGTERIAPGSCVTCHAPEYKTAKDHVDMKPNTCGVCHSQMTWAPSRIDHPWPLTGAHANNHCLWCHRSAKEGEPPKFAGTKKECWGCHKQEFKTSTFPDHETFPHTCEDCHSTRSWSPALENAKLPPPIPTVLPLPDAGPPDAAIAGGVDAATKPIPTVTVKVPPKKPDAGWPPPDIISHPSGHRGGGIDDE